MSRREVAKLVAAILLLAIAGVIVGVAILCWGIRGATGDRGVTALASALLAAWSLPAGIGVRMVVDLRNATTTRHHERGKAMTHPNPGSEPDNASRPWDATDDAGHEHCEVQS